MNFVIFPEFWLENAEHSNVRTCILDDETTKVVHLLPFSENGVTKVLAQRIWESSIAFFLQKFASSHPFCFLKVPQFWLKNGGY